MLKLLSVTNFATIEHVELELQDGLNVLTGETGAGKSILVDAVSLLVGGRADSGMVRAGAGKARLEGVFSLDEESGRRVNAVLEEHGAEPAEAGEIIVTREVSREGRNTCRLDGRIVPLRLLSALGAGLVDIHGQSEHLSLLRPREQLELLDRYGGLGGLRARLAEKTHRLLEVREEIRRLRQSEQEREQRIDLLRFQSQEIDEAALEPGEDAALETERDRLANAERLLSLAEEAYNMLNGEGDEWPSALDLVGRSVRNLQAMERLDRSVAEQRQSAEGLESALDELAHAVRGYADALEFDADRLEAVEERLELIARLKRKYGGSIEEVLEFGRKASEELRSLGRSEERIGELQSEEAELMEGAGRLAAELSEERREAGDRMAAAVEAELPGLAMERASVSVALRQRESAEGLPAPGTSEDNGAGASRRLAFDATGVDRVELLVSANPGEPQQPLSAVASEGETSRLMLAIKVVLSAVDQVPTLVFDEIDAGVGGRVGRVIGQKLAELSHGRQVLCVTHLPQIACYADHHLRVVKSTSGESTVTSASEVTGDERVEELSQMLGAVGQSSRQSAREMLEQADQWKSAGAAPGRKAQLF